VRIAPAGTEVFNPGFDVTPAELISGIVTEEGVISGPFEAGLAAATASAKARWEATPGFRRAESAPVAAAAAPEAPETGAETPAPEADPAAPAALASDEVSS
jgi:Initiation factor 2 subunit family